MKRAVAGFLVSCFVLGGAAGAARADESSAKQVGVYVGAKIGASVVNMNDRRFGQKGSSMIDSGHVFTWKEQTQNMGDGGDTVIGGGLNVGYDFSKRLDIPIRLELDYTIRDKSSKSGSLAAVWDVNMDGASIPGGVHNTIHMKTSVRLQTLMVNGWFDIPTGTAFKPYVGGGIGVAFVHYKATISENDDPASATKSANVSNFAWSLGGGLGYAITDAWTVDLGYRYINAGDAKVNFPEAGGLYYSKTKNIESHDIMLGVRYTF